ncbi:MAG: RNase adapter RapZ [Proteobacteria bacterium]|nr:RNase adapter RapZ [Pseudomonadota bacterium]
MQDIHKNIVVVSGLSGAGKSVALQSLEDIGYYCIDNMPLTLLPEFSRQLEDTTRSKRAAVSIDSRNLDFLQVLQGHAEGEKLIDDFTELIFLESTPDVLLRRYSETRRKHPLSDQSTNLMQSIDKEVALLAPLRKAADHTINTSKLTPHELREKIRQIVGRSKQGVMLSIESFGFKHGPPRHADFIFDVRCLPNPHWDASIRHLSGLDKRVVDFLEKEPDVHKMSDDIAQFLEKWLPAFDADNRSYLTLAIGCTGGHHRSVYTANRLAERLRQVVPNVQVQHRDL